MMDGASADIRPILSLEISIPESAMVKLFGESFACEETVPRLAAINQASSLNLSRKSEKLQNWVFRLKRKIGTLTALWRMVFVSSTTSMGRKCVS